MQYVFIILLLTSCASTQRTIALSALAGAGAGAINGVALYPINTKKGMLGGALIGATVGGLGGWLIHRSLENRDKKIRRETILNLTRHDVLNISQNIPPLNIPKPSEKNPQGNSSWTFPQNNFLGE